MGQLSHDLHINHFSHPHTLELSNAQTNPPRAALTPSLCAACKLPSSGWMYTCKQCIMATFTLHASCSRMPNLITHPSHTKHALTLLAKPAYPSGSFYCDACGRQGDGFSYHCAECEFDVHATCASKPLSVGHHMHSHQLQMEFFPPYNTKGFSCDICRSTGANHWLYRCAYCEFDAHLDCATSSTQTQTQAQVQVQVMQAQRPQPQASQQQWSQQVHSQPQQQVPTWPQQQVQAWPQPQLQVPQNYPQTGGANNQYQPQGMMNHSMPNATMGPVQMQQNGGQPGQAANNSLASQAHQSFVNAAADQPAQMFMQNLLGGGGGGGGAGVGSSTDDGGNNADGGGSSFFSSTFGNGDDIS